jgi:hypothetical protein
MSTVGPSGNTRSVQGIMVSIDSQGASHSQEYEYRSDKFFVDPAYGAAIQGGLVTNRSSVSTGSFFESSFTKNWFSIPRDIDSCQSYSPSPTPVDWHNHPGAVPDTGKDSSVSSIYENAAIAVQIYERSLSQYLAKVESGNGDAQELENERIALMDMYQNAFSNVSQYRQIYDQSKSNPSGAEAIRASHSQERARMQAPSRSRRVFHM